MTDYDVIVIGGGTGNNVAAAAAAAGLETALVEPGPLGGTCLNRGCNPTKMLIQPASTVEAVRESGRFHVDATVEGVDYARVVEETNDLLGGIAEGMKERYREKEHLTIYEEYTEFVDDRTLRLDGEDVTGEKVVIAAGSRPIEPPIDGLDGIDYLTSREAIRLGDPPDRLAVLGGGYVAVELGYLFEMMGTDVTIIEMMDTLVPREDDDVAEAFTDIAAERHDVHTGHRVTGVREAGGEYVVTAETEGGEAVELPADELLLALGRRPNTDTLNLEATGVETDDRGFIETNDYLETTAGNVWAQGDIAGNAMFKHSGDYETRHTIANVVDGERRAVDLSAMPHAIFTEPQIGGVGATEAELEGAGEAYLVGRADYADSSMGRAKKLEEGFMKVLASPEGEILGCHVLGYEASVLLHEPVVAMRNGLSVDEVADTIHVHPTLSKVVKSAFEDVRA